MVVFRLCSANKKVDIQTAVMQPVHGVVDNTVLEIDLTSPRVQTVLRKTEIYYLVRRGGLNVRRYQRVGGIIHNIVARAAVVHRTAELVYQRAVGTARSNDIASVDLGMLGYKIGIEAIAVVPRVRTALGYQPQPAQARTDMPAYRSERTEYQHKQQLAEIARNFFQL